jgi:hypothetical protein
MCYRPFRVTARPRKGCGASPLAWYWWGRSQVGRLGVVVAGLGGRVGHGGVALPMAGAMAPLGHQGQECVQTDGSKWLPRPASKCRSARSGGQAGR